jgi:hypothetical protein
VKGNDSALVNFWDVTTSNIIMLAWPLVNISGNGVNTNVLLEAIQAVHHIHIRPYKDKRQRASESFIKRRLPRTLDTKRSWFEQKIYA